MGCSILVLGMLIYLQGYQVAADEDAYYPLNWTTKELGLGENKLGYTYNLPPGFRWVQDGNFGSVHAVSRARHQAQGAFKDPRNAQLEFEELDQSLFLDVGRAFTRTECFWLIFACKMRILPQPIHSNPIHVDAIENFSIANHPDSKITSCIDAELVVSNPMRLIQKVLIGRVYLFIKYRVGLASPKAGRSKQNFTAIFPISLAGGVCDSIYKIEK